MRNQGSQSDRESIRGRAGRSNFEGVEGKGRIGSMVNQMSENLPKMEETLRYVGDNWKTFAKGAAVLGFIGAFSTIARKNSWAKSALSYGRPRHRGQSRRTSKMKH